MTAPVDLTSWYPDGLQRMYDATSLAPLLGCLRRYRLQVALGHGGKSRALAWGIAFHAGIEAQDRALADGAGHDDALAKGLADAHAHATWSEDDDADPDALPRNRLGLARALIWRQAELNERGPDPVTFARLPDGSPAIESRFVLPGGFYPDGRQWFLSGRFDGLVRFGGRLYVRDIKTTVSALTAWYWRRYAPNVQVALYDYAAAVLFGSQHDGVMIEAVQIGAGFARTERKFIVTSAHMRTDLLAQIHDTAHRAFAAHNARVWLPNYTACQLCDFAQACQQSPAVRERMLAAEMPARGAWKPTGE